MEQKKIHYFGAWGDIRAYLSNLLDTARESKAKKIILLLITRKGYWLFKTLVETDTSLKAKVDSLIESEKLQICSDRYILKELVRESGNSKEGSSILANKTVWIFDDTVNNGNTLFYYYCKARRLHADDVSVMVYAAPTDFLAHRREEVFSENDECRMKKFDQYKRIFKEQNKDDGVYEDFKKKLREFYKCFSFHVVLPRQEVAELSIEECLRFQENVNSMVMDLPVLSLRNSERKEVILSKEKFEKLKTKTARWEYVENRYEELGETLVCDFFQLNNDLLYSQYKDLFFNFIVKCKYKEMPDGVKAKFIPFAMIKSASMESVWNCYCGLFKDVKKVDGIIAQDTDTDAVVQKMKKNHNMCRAIYRAIVYELSNYVAGLFAEKVRSDLDFDLVNDQKYMKDHSDNAFVEALYKDYNTVNMLSYEQRIASCKEIVGLPAGIETQKKGEEQATEQSIWLFVHNRVLESKTKQGGRVNKIIRIEDIEREMDEIYSFVSERQKRLYLTKTLILLLEISAIGNEIVVDNSNETIYRGFRAGENSEVLMPPGLRWVYPYICAFYYFRGDTFFLEHYERFSLWLRGLFREKQYIGTLLDSETFEFYLDYFGKIDETRLYDRISSKSYILENKTDKKAQERQEVFVQIAYDRVREWGDTVYAE